MNKDKRKAFYAFKEASKCDHGNWRVWENLVVAAVDVGAFIDACMGIQELVRIRGGFNDGEVLRIIARGMTIPIACIPSRVLVEC